MNIHTTIREILLDADRQLRQAIAEAATGGDLDAVDLARNAAGRLRQMINGLEESGQPTVDSIPGPSIGAKPAEAGKSRSSKPAKGKTNYPKYRVQSDYLYRIGWSKKARKEYEHKVARDIFDETINTMSTLSHDLNGPISADQIINKINKSSSVTVPNYQIYVVIGFLRDHTNIKQVGRQGYELPKDLRDQSTARWQELAKGEA